MDNKKMNKSTEKINKLYNYLIKKQYGDFIEYNEIEYIIKIPHTEKQFSIYIRCAKNKLIEHSKVLKAIPGRGYQILKPTQVSSYVYRTYISRALKAYNNSEKILEYLDTDNFNEDRKEEYENISELNDELKKVSIETIKQSKYYSRKDYYNNLEEKEEWEQEVQ